LEKKPKIFVNLPGFINIVTRESLFLFFTCFFIQWIRFCNMILFSGVITSSSFEFGHFRSRSPSDLVVRLTMSVKKCGISSDHIPRSNPVPALLLHCPRVHGFSLFGKLDCLISLFIRTMRTQSPPPGWCRFLVSGLMYRCLNPTNPTIS